MTTDQSIDKDGLRRDSATVLDAHKTVLETKIANFAATPIQIIDWYYSTDPLRESTSQLTVDIHGINGKIDYDTQISYLADEYKTPLLNEIAGLSLVASVAIPSTAISNGEPWLNRLVGNSRQNSYKTMAKNAELMLDPLIQNLPNNLSSEQLQTLFIAIDCLHNANFRYYLMSQNQLLCDLHPFYSLEDIASKSAIYYKKSMELANKLMFNANSDQDQESREVVFNSGMFWGSAMLGLPMRVNTIDNVEDMYKEVYNSRWYGFSAMHHSVDKYFLNSPFYPDRKVIKGADKGKLHEALWLMDINYLLGQEESGLESFGIALPTFPRVDQPKIDYPQYRRAYDIHIALTSRQRTLPVQLKSSPNASENGQDYHPNIHVVTENNFQEVDTRRLAAKLAAYKAWLDSGMKPELEPNVNKYLLPSAVAFLATVREIESLSTPDYKMMKFPTASLDRAAKRRLRRTIRKNPDE